MLADERARRFRVDRRLRLRRRRAARWRAARRSCRGSMPGTPWRSTIRSRPRRFRGRGSRVLARRRASTTSCPCVFEGGAIAVLALGRKENDEPFNSEDLALLTAVAGQVATAIENGRLYRQLHLKAEELGPDARVQREHPRVARRRAGRVRSQTSASSAGTTRSKRSTACRARTPSAARWATSSMRLSSKRCARRVAEHPDGATLFTVPLTGHRCTERRHRRACWSMRRWSRCRTPAAPETS